jgi:hypothetical protein
MSFSAFCRLQTVDDFISEGEGERKKPASQTAYDHLLAKRLFRGTLIEWEKSEYRSEAFCYLDIYPKSLVGSKVAG